MFAKLHFVDQRFETCYEGFDVKHFKNRFCLENDRTSFSEQIFPCEHGQFGHRSYDSRAAHA